MPDVDPAPATSRAGRPGRAGRSGAAGHPGSAGRAGPAGRDGSGGRAGSAGRPGPASGPVRASELAPFGRRVGALLVDWAIAMAIAYGFAGGDAMAILGIFAAERILVGGLTGASIGHRLTGLRVVHVSRGRATFVAVVVRTVLLCLVLPALWRTVEGVPLHDDLARTRLVRG